MMKLLVVKSKVRVGEEEALPWLFAVEVAPAQAASDWHHAAGLSVSDLMLRKLLVLNIWTNTPNRIPATISTAMVRHPYDILPISLELNVVEC